MSDRASQPPLGPRERAIYEWQLPVAGFGVAGQEKLRRASVLISRVGGVGGVVALELAAAGVGRLILAHAGQVKPGDLNRQVLLTHDWLGKPRVECAARRLRELNPRLEITAVPENASEANAERWLREADLVVDCAPMFEERFALNRAAVRQRKPMVECAVYELEAHLTTFLPGQSPCLRCLYPDLPADWRREFPVFGAVAGAVGGLAAMEVIKAIAGFGQLLIGRLLAFDLRDVSFRSYQIRRVPNCPECGTV